MKKKRNLFFKKDFARHPDDRVRHGCRTKAAQILADLTASETPKALSALLTQLDAWVRETLAGDAGPCHDADRTLGHVFDTVSDFNEILTSRLIQQTVQTIAQRDGRGPPLPFCWITLGSDARGEQVIRTDQDNALIYADPPQGEAAGAAAYFAALAGEVNQALDGLGFALCPGEVMASNPRWCRSLSQWLSALDDWVGSSDPMAVRNLTILLDFKAVFGDRRLAAMLHTKVFTSFESHPAASHFLVRDDQLFAPPKALFNRIRTKKEAGCRACFNLKTQALAHIVNGARLFAVNRRLRVPATLKRLESLAGDDLLSPQEYLSIRAAFVFLSRLKIRRHLHRESAAPALPANRIDISRLDWEEKKALHAALDAVAAFQKKMAAAYSQNWMNFFN